MHQVIVAGNGFQPSQDDLRALMKRGYIPGDARIRPTSAKHWDNANEARSVVYAMADTVKTELKTQAEPQVEMVSMDNRQFGVILFNLGQPKKKPWWKFW